MNHTQGLCSIPAHEFVLGDGAVFVIGSGFECRFFLHPEVNGFQSRTCGPRSFTLGRHSLKNIFRNFS